MNQKQTPSTELPGDFEVPGDEPEPSVENPTPASCAQEGQPDLPDEPIRAAIVHSMGNAGAAAFQRNPVPHPHNDLAASTVGSLEEAVTREIERANQ